MKNAKDNRQTNPTHVNQLAHWLDDRFKIPGTDIRFGLDPIIGLIPGAGDWFAGMISSYFILLGARAEVAPTVLMRMGFNVLLDILIGSIPLLGDLFDVAWKANTRNAKLLEKYQKDKEITEKHSKWLLWTISIIFLVLIIALLWFIGWLVVEIFGAIF